MAVLTLDHVSYRYTAAHRSTVDAVTAQFERGKLYAIVGPSGSGKSTLLSLMAGLDKPQSGDVLFGDASLADMDLDRYRRESVAMIFQAFHLFPLLTAMENVCFPMSLQKIPAAEAKKRAAALLASVGITNDQFGRTPAKLSGGEQQRVAIARALAARPKVLFADEPTGNLDSENGQNVIDILARLAHEEELCVVIVTHDMEIAARADTVYRMRDGVLHAIEPKTQRQFLASNAFHPWTTIE